jgi:predicted DNA-binding protein (MmcQ/YjbR family)
MISFKTFQQLALSFPETSEQPHFEKPSFRIGKKIFATYDKQNNRACIKLSEADQDVFSLFDKSIIYSVPNKWGKQGWTNIELNKIKKGMIKELLTAAYNEVAPKKLKVLSKTENR